MIWEGRPRCALAVGAREGHQDAESGSASTRGRRGHPPAVICSRLRQARAALYAHGGVCWWPRLRAMDRHVGRGAVRTLGSGTHSANSAEWVGAGNGQGARRSLMTRDNGVQVEGKPGSAGFQPADDGGLEACTTKKNLANCVHSTRYFLTVAFDPSAARAAPTIPARLNICAGTIGV
jgi:hypothetical protein